MSGIAPKLDGGLSSDVKMGRGVEIREIGTYKKLMITGEVTNIGVRREVNHFRGASRGNGIPTITLEPRPKLVIWLDEEKKKITAHVIHWIPTSYLN
jgi:hypothetical protein